METRKVNLCMFTVLPPPPLLNMFSVCLVLGLSGANRATTNARADRVAGGSGWGQSRVWAERDF